MGCPCGSRRLTAAWQRPGGRSKLGNITAEAGAGPLPSVMETNPLFLTPTVERIFATFIYGEPAIRAAQEAPVAPAVQQAMLAVQSNAKGKTFDMPLRMASDLADLQVLLELKAAH